MSEFGRRIRPYVDAELKAAIDAEAKNNPTAAFSHLERAHVLGQASTVQHVRAHWHMLGWAIRQGDRKEIFGQLVRLVGAATKTFAGLVPEGNTGGANVSPIQPLPIPPDLASIIHQARSRASDRPGA